MRIQVSLLVGLLAGALAGCGAEAGAPSGRAGVSVSALTSLGAITAVRVEAQPANVTRALTYDASTGKFSGSLLLPVGGQTLTARAYVGDRLAAQGTATVTIVGGQTASVVMRLLDASTPAPLGDVAPAILALTTSSVQPAVGEAVTMSVSAADANGDALSYEWTSDCTTTSTFSTPASATTRWTSTAAGVCRITITVRANGRSATEQVDVTALETGSGAVSIEGTYVEGPRILVVNASATGFSCPLGSSETTCPGRLAPGQATQLNVIFALGEAAPSTGEGLGAVQFSLTDSCGGTTGVVSVSANGKSGQANATWTPPSSAAVCELTVRVTQETMVGQRAFAIVVR